MSRRRSVRGFTLIEVLVALVIVAIGMAALLGTLSSAADSVVYLRDKTFGGWIALNRISELRLAAKAPAKGKASGDVDYAGRRWHYEQDIVETDVPGVLRIDVRVRDAAADAGKAGKAGKTKESWTATASGVIGDAVLAPNGVDPDWNGSAFEGEPANPENPPGPTDGSPPPPEPPAAPPPQPGGPLPTS